MKRGLIADDENEVCAILETYLAEKNFEVCTTTNGPSIMSLVREFKPQTVLLDLAMPGVLGLKVLKEIKKFDPAVRIIVITAVTDSSKLRKAREYGAAHYLIKPLNLQSLVQTLSD